MTCCCCCRYVVVSVLQSSTRLLTDELPDVRRSAAHFVTHLPWIPQHDTARSAHASYTLHLLFKHLIAPLSSSPVCRKLIADWLAVINVSDVIAVEASQQYARHISILHVLFVVYVTVVNVLRVTSA